MSTDIFGAYQSQSTRVLASISSTKYPDTNKDFEANVVRLNSFVDYIAQYLQIMQKGVDQASLDPIGKIKSTFSDLIVLLGGGELLYGIDLGDLQYFLPALGALFGFDADVPFPINLFNAAEQFFLGYVVPLDSFASTIEDIIIGLLTGLGLDDETIANIKELLDAVSAIATDFFDLFQTISDLFSVFGIDTSGFGPFADIWHTISQLLGGFNLDSLGGLIDPIFHGLAPWVSQLTNLLNIVDNILKAFSGGVVDIQGILNFSDLFSSFDFLSGDFDISSAWSNIIDFAGIGDLFDGIINAILTGIRRIPIIGGTIADVIAELTGLADTTEQANGPTNPAIVDLAGRIKVVETTTDPGAGNAWSDNWDRSAVGSDYTSAHGTALVNGSYVRSNSSFALELLYTANTFATAQQYGQVRIPFTQFGIGMYVIMCATDFTSGVGIQIVDAGASTSGHKLRIVSISDYNSTVTRDEYVLGRTWAANDVVGIGFSTASEIYQAYINDVPVSVGFHDPGAAICPIGSSNRSQLMVLNQNSGGFGSRGPAMDNTIGYDWV